MTTYRTNNAIGSTDPRDLYDNSENLDELVNSWDKLTHPDRFGEHRKTWHGMEKAFEDAQEQRKSAFQGFLQKSGYVGTGTDGAVEEYAAGINITARNQVVRANGELWRLSAAAELPYVTTGTGMPEEGMFVSVGDAALRQEWGYLPSAVDELAGGLSQHIESENDAHDAAAISINPDETIQGTNLDEVVRSVSRYAMQAMVSFQRKQSASDFDLSALPLGGSLFIQNGSLMPAIYKKVATEPDHPGKVQSRDGSWFELSQYDIAPHMFGDIGNGNDRAVIAKAFQYAARRHGVTVNFPEGEYIFEQRNWIEIPANTKVVLDSKARIINPFAGNHAGIFSISASTHNVEITGAGSLVGPYEHATPDPALDANSDYVDANGCIRILGNVREPCKNIRIHGPEIVGWGLFGIFIEAGIDGGVYGGTRIRRCGRDGIRMYGCKNFWVGNGIEISDITPGLGGTAPRFNAYGVTATRRATRTTRLSNFDDFSSGWTLTEVSVGSHVSGSTGISKLQKITPNSSNSAHQLRQDVSLSPSQTWTASFEAKADGYNALRISLTADSTGDGIRAHFNLLTGEAVASGVLGNGGSVISAQTEPLGNGIFRCILRGSVKPFGSFVRCTAQVLQNTSVSLTSGGSFSGDGSLGVLLGESQLIEGNRNWFARASRENPPSESIFMIGGTVRGVPTWKALDTHGGVNIHIKDWELEDCCFAVGVDEGDTSGIEDAPPINVFIDGINAKKGRGSGGGAFINISSSSAENLGSNIKIGSQCKGEGFGMAGYGAITLSYCDDVTIDGPTLTSNTRPALWVHAGPVSGSVRLQARNCAAGPAMIVINSTKANILLEGGRLRQASSLPAIAGFSINNQDTGYSVQNVTENWKLENNITS